VERGTLGEAKAMLQKAVAHYKTVGRTQALADFTGRKPPFIDRDLYVVCIGPNGIVTAHGSFPAYVGASADILKDAGGKPVGTTIWNTGSSKGAGSIQFPMVNPISSKVEQKNTFFEKVGDDVCAVGAYNPL
jgi:cytochrome c